MLAFIGFLMPPLIDIVNRRIKDADVRWMVSFSLCLIVGLVVNFIEANGLTGYSDRTLLDIFSSFGQSIMVVWAASQITYKNPVLSWEDSDARDELGLNSKTN